MAARKWTSAQRIAQGNAIRKWKPWQSSTGPRTCAGKEMASRNSIKHGCHSQWVRELRILERHVNQMSSVIFTIADDLEFIRLNVSKMIADLASRKGEPKALLTAHRFVSLQTAKAEANLFCPEKIWWGYPANANFILRC